MHSGKTRISLLIEQILTAYGFNVDFIDQDGIPYVQLERIKSDLPEALANLSKTTKIQINQKQEKRVWSL